MYLPVNEKDLDVLALEDSLKALAQVDVRKAQVVELASCGRNFDEAAEVHYLGIEGCRT